MVEELQAACHPLLRPSSTLVADDDVVMEEIELSNEKTELRLDGTVSSRRSRRGYCIYT